MFRGENVQDIALKSLNYARNGGQNRAHTKMKPHWNQSTSNLQRLKIGHWYWVPLGETLTFYCSLWVEREAKTTVKRKKKLREQRKEGLLVVCLVASTQSGGWKQRWSVITAFYLSLKGKVTDSETGSLPAYGFLEGGWRQYVLFHVFQYLLFTLYLGWKK